MKIGDLVEYIPSTSYGKRERDLGTVVRLDPEFRDTECYVVWHTTNNEGWWNAKCLQVVSKNESR